MTKRHKTLNELSWQQQTGYSFATVHLSRGETVENPVCPTCRLHGPMVLELRRYRDGGIDARIVVGHDGHAR